jgi:murein DD-endopeptidase MepM/ murein hydrolase activator NlpD
MINTTTELKLTVIVRSKILCRRILLLSAAIFALQGCGGSSSSVADLSCSDAAAGTYPVQSTSPYVLPYSIGETYVVGQGNCTNFSHNASINQQFAYDILMPIGTTLVASRSGVIVAVEENFSDGTGVPGEENFVVIEHDDGTTSRYIHLTTLGALVDLQDTVVQGQAIGISGHSGNSTEPHLHFDVGDGPCTPHVNTNCRSLPVNFRNTSPHVNGLVQGQSYTAEL